MAKKLYERQIIKAANAIAERLVENGFHAYWVGGCVRNQLLGLPPEDIDIATNAKPDQIISLFKKTLPVGVKYGVVIVILKGVQTEVATFRSDGEYIDHRHPLGVHFSSAEEDAKRRDFTINALFYDPIKDKIIDFVGGKEDLQKGIIRGIGNPSMRIREDALRMLRAVRFAARFNFEIEPNTKEAVKEHASLIQKISADRIRTELIKILCGPQPGDAVKMLYDFGLLRLILPEVAAMKGVPQPPEFHPEGDVFEHTCLTLNFLKNPSPNLAMASLLHDIGKPPTFKVTDRIRFNLHNKVGAEMAAAVCRRLNFSLKDQKIISSLVERHMDFLNIKDMRESKLKRFLSSDTIKEDLALHKADCLASHGDTSNVDFCSKKLKEFKKEQTLNPPLLLSGNDLIKLGYEPGPLFTKILNSVRDAQLENIISTKDESIKYILKHFPI